MTEYNRIAKDYVESEKTRHERIYIIDPSFIKRVGDVKEKTILDLACGDGNFSRTFKKLGAKEIIGIDLSEEMIKLAKENTKKENLDIKYIIGDVTKLKKIKEFDLVIAAFLLHYSKTKEEILNMCKNIYSNLKKDGKFITINQSETPIKDIKEFGCVVTGSASLKEGDALTVTLYVNMKPTCSFTTYHWSKKTYEKCLKEAGFKNIRWHNLETSEEGKKKYPEKNWNKFTEKAYVIILEATK
jgi:ubiquinone/menaquinone biosynthesis C-methylase UbiE